MFDTFFTQIKVRSRMESGPIGPYLSEIAAVLHREATLVAPFAGILGLRIILALGFSNSNKEWWSLISVLPPWITTWKDWVVNFLRLAHEVECLATHQAYGS
jgi:hypothetical protein